jgi:ketosteroid isomerase-like protein
MMLEIAFALGIAGGQPGNSAPPSKEFEQIEQQLATTWKSGDCDGWASHIAPEWSVIHVTGATITRAQALQTCRMPPAPITASSIDEISVRSFGDTAVVTGRTMVATGGSKPVTVRLRFTDVFVRRNGRWQVVASHATQLASQ